MTSNAAAVFGNRLANFATIAPPAKAVTSFALSIANPHSPVNCIGSASSNVGDIPKTRRHGSRLRWTVMSF
jgi:hypothetical protein